MKILTQRKLLERVVLQKFKFIFIFKKLSIISGIFGSQEGKSSRIRYKDVCEGKHIKSKQRDSKKNKFFI